MYALMQFVKSIFEAFVELNALISSFERIIEMLRGMKDNVRTNNISCDTCAVSTPTPSIDHIMPFGWFILIEKRGMIGERESHFCSAKCLKDWAAKIEIVEMEKRLTEVKE